jgi:hypothetical protein
MALDFVAGAHVYMAQRRQVATDARRQEAARRTLEKASERADCEERYNTIIRGRNTTVMIGRQREPHRAHLEEQMAKLIQPMDRYRLYQVRMLTGDSEARHITKYLYTPWTSHTRMSICRWRDGTIVRGSEGEGRGGGILR